MEGKAAIKIFFKVIGFDFSVKTPWLSQMCYAMEDLGHHGAYRPRLMNPLSAQMRCCCDFCNGSSVWKRMLFGWIKYYSPYCSLVWLHISHIRLTRFGRRRGMIGQSEAQVLQPSRFGSSQRRWEQAALCRGHLACTSHRLQRHSREKVGLEYALSTLKLRLAYLATMELEMLSHAEKCTAWFWMIFSSVDTLSLSNWPHTWDFGSLQRETSSVGGIVTMSRIVVPLLLSVWDFGAVNLKGQVNFLAEITDD